jgi:hypothetical protein
VSDTPFVSVSQITTFRDECERRWAFRLLARIDEPQTDAAKLGDEVDKEQLQPHLREGRPFDYSRPSGYIAEAGRAHLPPPMSPGLEVQKFFTMASPTGLTGGKAKFGYLGYLDLWLPDSSCAPGMLPRAPGVVIPCVGDFKTTKDPDKWRKDEDALRKDVQAITYATWAMLHTGARTVDLAWIYFRTDPKKSPKSIRTYVRMDAPEIVDRFREIDAVANQMIDIRQAATGKDPVEYALSLPPNPKACEMYGRTCPYAVHCNLGPAEIIESLAARDRRRLPVVNDEKEGSMNAPNATEEFKARLARLRGGAAAAPTITTPSPVMGMADTAVPAPPAGVIPPAFLPPPAPQPLPINPPESALPPAPPVGTVAAPAPTAEPPKPPARRGRPPKSQAERGLDGVAPGEPPAPVVNNTVVVAPPTAATPAAPSSGKPVGTAYLDAYPVGGQYTTAEELYAEVNRTIQEKHGVTDYRLIDFKGSGVFASRLALLLDELGAVGDVVCDTRTPEGSIAKSVFAARAERVVQGTR